MKQCVGGGGGGLACAGANGLNLKAYAPNGVNSEPYLLSKSLLVSRRQVSPKGITGGELPCRDLILALCTQYVPPPLS